MRKFLIILSIITALFSSEKIVVKSTKIMDKNGTTLGFLYPGVSVEILEEKDTLALVKFSGVMDECCPKIYKDFIKFQLGATIYDKNYPKLISQISNSKKSVEILGYISKNDLGSSDKEIKDLAKTLYAGECARCHVFFPADSFEPKEWIGIMSDMRDRANINNHEAEVLLYYLQENDFGF